MRHLTRSGTVVWCEDPTGELTDDPRDSDCSECLREAAEYGAAAAMRCAAVESMASSDPELRQERDHALAQVAKIQKALNDVGWFWCAGCDNIIRTEDAGMLVPIRMCRGCVR